MMFGNGALCNLTMNRQFDSHLPATRLTSVFGFNISRELIYFILISLMTVI